MWAMIIKKLIWAFLILNLSSSRNHKICDSRELKSTNFSLWEIEFSSVKYDDEKEYYDKKELM